MADDSKGPSPCPNSRQEAEVEAVVNSLRGYGVL